MSNVKEKNNTEEIIISVIPLDRPKNWSSENAYLYEYVVSLNTNVIFLGEVYRQVYCLDISPSVSTVVSYYLKELYFYNKKFL